MKKFLALILAITMLLALAACTGGENSDLNGGEADASLEGAVVSMTILSHPSWPFDENWKVWEYIEESTGATLDINAVPSSDYFTKYSLMYSSPETVTDVTCFDYKPDSDVYAIQGALVALEDLEEYMPTYTAFVESLSEKEYNTIVKVRKGFDGKIYYAPATGREAVCGTRTWLYRKDIFEKNNLSVPTTFEELYTVCKKLKEIYPDSFPLAIRQNFKNFDVTGGAWKPYWCTGVYYDYNENKWNYGAGEPITLDILTYYKRMVDEGLMPANFYTISATEWQELITTDRGFIMPEYQTRIDFFNGIAREHNPEFNLQAMNPPVATEQGEAKLGLYNNESLGFAISNSGNETRIRNAARFVDWFYTDDAYELLSWGKEGETYEVVNGKKQYILDDKGSQVNALYGFLTYGTFLRVDPEASFASQSADIEATRDMVLGNLYDEINPVLYLAFNEEEQKIKEEYAATIKTYAEEQMLKFILGMRPLSEFDQFAKSLDEMGVDKLISIYESAYNRIK